MAFRRFRNSFKKYNPFRRRSYGGGGRTVVINAQPPRRRRRSFSRFSRTGRKGKNTMLYWIIGIIAVAVAAFFGWPKIKSLFNK